MNKAPGNASQRRSIKRLVLKTLRENTELRPASTIVVPAAVASSSSLDKWPLVLTLIPLAVGLAVSGYSFLAPAPSAQVGAALLLVSLILSTTGLWFWIRLNRLIKVFICLPILLLTSFFALRWEREVTRPSFAYLAPAVLFGEAWDFIVYHRGPKNSESVQMEFIDQDKQQEILRNHPKFLTNAMIDTYEQEVSVGEVNPKGRGGLYAKQFQWKPPVLDHEHYVIAISAKDSNVAEELRIERMPSGWSWYIRVKDRETGKWLFQCIHGPFPINDPSVPLCPSPATYNE